MNRKVYWGLGVLIILLIGVSIFLLMRNTDTEPIVVYKGDVEPAKETIDNLRNEASKNNPPPDVSPNTVPIAQGENTSPETQTHRRPFSEMPMEERMKAIEDWYRQDGLEIPPDGYVYLWESPGIPRRDENGNPILLKRGEPYFEVTPSIGFRPTREQYEQYKQMGRDAKAAAMRGDEAEVQRLYKARKIFRDEHRGELPSITTLGGTRGVDYSNQIREKANEAYRAAGLDYLIGQE